MVGQGVDAGGLVGLRAGGPAGFAATLISNRCREGRLRRSPPRLTRPQRVATTNP